MTIPISQRRVAEFLRDLSKLATEHKLRIAGCGCCNSPYMVDLTNEPIEGQYVVGHPMCSQVTWMTYDGKTHDGGTPVEIES